MAIASITTWLNKPDRNYFTGRLLYEQYGTNPVTMALLKSGQGSYHFSKLQAALEALNLQTDLVPKQIVIDDYVKEPAAPQQSIDYKTAPEQIIAIRDEKTKRYAQARKLHETIRIMDNKEHRLAAALSLLDHMDYVNECWASIDLFKKTGEVKPIPQEEKAKELNELSITELLKEEKNLQSYISKAKKKLSPGNKPAVQLEITTRIDWWIQRLKDIRSRLQKELV